MLIENSNGEHDRWAGGVTRNGDMIGLKRWAAMAGLGCQGRNRVLLDPLLNIQSPQFETGRERVVRRARNNCPSR